MKMKLKNDNERSPVCFDRFKLKIVLIFNYKIKLQLIVGISMDQNAKSILITKWRVRIKHNK